MGMKISFTQMCALGAIYPGEIDEVGYETIRDKFYSEFRVGSIQQVDYGIIVALVPCGRWETAKEFFKGAELIENLDIIVTNERT